MAALHDHPTQMEKCLVDELADGRDLGGRELAGRRDLLGDDVLEPVDLGVGDGLLVGVDELEDLSPRTSRWRRARPSSGPRQPARRTRSSFLVVSSVCSVTLAAASSAVGAVLGVAVFVAMGVPLVGGRIR